MHVVRVMMESQFWDGFAYLLQDKFGKKGNLFEMNHWNLLQSLAWLVTAVRDGSEILQLVIRKNHLALIENSEQASAETVATLLKDDFNERTDGRLTLHAERKGQIHEHTHTQCGSWSLACISLLSSAADNFVHQPGEFRLTFVLKINSLNSCTLTF